MISIREQALRNMVEVFSSMEVGLPSIDPYTVQFDYVRRNPLDEDSWKKTLTMGIHDTNEVVSQSPALNNRELKVVLEFRRLLQTDEVASEAGSEIMANIQRRIAEDNTLGGLVIDTTEYQNELYIDDFDHRQLSGAVFLKVKYRTAASDPRRRQ